MDTVIDTVLTAETISLENLSNSTFVREDLQSYEDFQHGKNASEKPFQYARSYIFTFIIN